MSTNRFPGPLQKVEPTRSLIVTSMPCEKKCAIIRNKTVDDMNHNNISSVAYRYLLNKQGEKNTFNEIFLHMILLIPQLFVIKNASISSMPNNEKVNDLMNFFYIVLFFNALLCSTLCMGAIICDISNTRRYKETKNGCEEWLSRRINKESLNRIKKILHYNSDGLFQLKKDLEQDQIDTTLLDEKIQYKNQKT